MEINVLDDTLLLKEVRALADAIASSLPVRIQIAALTLKSKLPFKALSIRELLIHRMSALATAAVELYEAQRVVPAIVLTRAAVETLAVLFSLCDRITRFLEDHDISELDNFLMQGLLGSRNNPDVPTAVNVLTSVDRMDKKIKGFRQAYDGLCEYAHPNWAGTFGVFGEIDRDAFELKLGPSARTKALSTGLAALSGTLMGFTSYYDKSADLVHELNDYFEQASG